MGNKMKISDNKEEQRSLDVSEQSRDGCWRKPSFVAQLFCGKVDWDIISPFPKQDEKDKRIGDFYISKMDACLKEHVDPEEIDRTGHYPKRTLEELSKILAFGMRIPRKYGGLGLSITNFDRVMELVGGYCGSTATWLSAHQSIGAPQPLALFGTEKQKDMFLPRLAKGAISAFALTEPDVGSDPARMRTEAKLSDDGSHYILNGEKLWTTNGPDADIMVVMAKTPPKVVDGKEKQQISAFIVEPKSSAGFEVVHSCSFMGLKGISNGLLRFDDVHVPKENLLGDEGQGLKIAFSTLNTGRLTLPAICLGASKRLLSYSRRWSNKRVQWGLPIGKHEAVKKRLADMAADVFAMEAMVRLTSSLVDKDCADIRLEAAMAKYFCTEKAWKICDDAMQIRGGRGYENETSLEERGEDPYPIERIFRDMRINRIIEGTSDIMQLYIAREAMDTHLRYILPIIEKKGNILLNLSKAAGFYSAWYPKLWLPSRKLTDLHLYEENRKNLVYIQREAKILGRKLFHTMARYQQKLSRHELVLADFVDIGTELFAMASVLSYVGASGHANPGDAQDLAALYCENAKDRIARLKKSLRIKHEKMSLVGKDMLDGRYGWLE